MKQLVHIKELRIKHKTELVETAFRIYKPAFDNPQQQKDYWIKRLIDGVDIYEFICNLKSGIPIYDTQKNIPTSLSHGSIGRIRVIDNILVFHADLKRKLWVRIENHTNHTFQTTPEEPVFVSYHWHRNNGEIYDFDGLRTPLPSPVSPGQHIELPINVIPPADPGEYRLMLTMVHEGHAWMEEKGLDVHILDCTVHDYDGCGLSRHAMSVFKQLALAVSNGG